MKTQTEKQTLTRLRALRKICIKKCRNYRRDHKNLKTSYDGFSYGWEIGYKCGIIKAIEILNEEIKDREWYIQNGYFQIEEKILK